MTEVSGCVRNSILICQSESTYKVYACIALRENWNWPSFEQAQEGTNILLSKIVDFHRLLTNNQFKPMIDLWNVSKTKYR